MIFFIMFQILYFKTVFIHSWSVYFYYFPKYMLRSILSKSIEKSIFYLERYVFRETNLSWIRKTKYRRKYPISQLACPTWYSIRNFFAQTICENRPVHPRRHHGPSNGRIGYVTVVGKMSSIRNTLDQSVLWCKSFIINFIWLKNQIGNKRAIYTINFYSNRV